MRIKQSCPEGWYVLCLTQTCDQDNIWFGKTPIVCWEYDPLGEKPPIPYGHRPGLWTEFNNKVCGSGESRLIPLAFDGILAPNETVIAGDGSVFDSFESFVRDATRYNPECTKMCDEPGTEAPQDDFG